MEEVMYRIVGFEQGQWDEAIKQLNQWAEQGYEVEQTWYEDVFTPPPRGQGMVGHTTRIRVFMLRKNLQEGENR